MSLDVPAVQQALASEGVDGWLLYDFHGSNPIAVSLAGLTGAHTTRRWYYFIPASGVPQKLVHAIEPHVLEGLPGERREYAGREELERGVTDLLRGSRVVAMEYSPMGVIPYLGRVDAGTIEFIRARGVEVVSSGDLIGQFAAAWDETAIGLHKQASEKLHRIKDQTFAFVASALSAGRAVDEFAIQQQMMAWFREEQLTTDAPPIVAAQENAGNPHYSPTVNTSRRYVAGELLLLDLWGKLEQPGAVYADITWVGFSGEAPKDIVEAFDAVLAGRDAAVALVTSRAEAGQPLRGWEVDRAARDVISAAGYGRAFIHRTGHSLGEDVHGNGVHMDDYETRDERRLVPGTGFTIEPGIYTPSFGVRTEINMVMGSRGAKVTGPCQRELVPIG